MEHVSLKSLIFNSYDDYAKINVDVRKSSLSYSTQYLIDVINVNRILNMVKKNNPEIDLNDCIRTTEFGDFSEYTLNLNGLEDCLFNADEVDFMLVNSLKKQIRA